MSRSVNKITLIGNVGRDPDMQQNKSGTKVAHFSLATNPPTASRKNVPIGTGRHFGTVRRNSPRTTYGSAIVFTSRDASSTKPTSGME